jgi:membrane protein DedA with SNARE-associated domain
MKMDFGHRTTTELVVLILTILVASVLTMLIGGAVLARIIHPEIEMNKAAEMATNTISTIVGALVGFISGRAYGKAEVNGNKEQPNG